MNDNTKRLLLIGGSLIVIGGVAYYFWNKSKADADKNELTDSEDSTPNGEPGVTVTNPGGGNVVNPPSPVSTLPVELNSVEKVKAFQDFMDNVGAWIKGADGKYKKLNKGAGYGIAGPSTKATFNVYGDLYRVYTRVGTKGRIIPLGSGLTSAAIDVDLSNGTIARYSKDRKFVQFAKNYGSVVNRGEWTNGGRKIAIYTGTKTGKTIDKNSIWDTLKELIA
jgi:hypothetical protein